MFIAQFRYRFVPLAGLIAALMLSLTTRSSISFADGVADEAELQFQIGADAYGKGEFQAALLHFLASNRLAPNRNVMFNIARAYEQLSRFSDAYRYYSDAGRGVTDAKTEKDVATAIARVAPKVAVVSIESVPPGATIYLNRRDLGSVGTAPNSLGLNDGKYIIIAQLDGYQPYTSDIVTAAVGEVQKLNIKLERILAEVIVTGASGTAVRFDREDGAADCQVPCTFKLVPGDHVAYFVRPGFSVVPQRFSLTAGTLSRVDAQAVALVGSLLVSADESLAVIEIDGKASGFTPTVVPGVPVGKHKVKVSLRGFAPVEREVEIKANEQIDMTDIELIPVQSVAAASRQDERIEDAPASVSIITAQELAAFGYPTILEALRGVRGFAVNYDSTYGNAAVRGLGQSNDFSNRLLVLSDGAVLNENILYQPFIHYDGRADLGDVDRIEIIRGPSSVLYGTGAVSGVVNLVMRDRTAPDGVAVSASTYDNATARLRFSLVKHLGRNSGAWASLATAGSQGRNAELIFATEPDMPASPQVTTTFDKFNTYTATARAWHKDLELQVFYTNRRSFVPTGNYGSRFDDPRNFADDTRLLLELKYRSKLGAATELSVRGHVNRATFLQRFRYDLDAPETGDYLYQERYTSTWLGVEGRLAYQASPTIKLTAAAEATAHLTLKMAGGDFDKEETTYTQALAVDSPYQVIAGSLLADIKLSDQVRLNGGIRLDFWNLQGNRVAVEPSPKGATSFLAPSPRLVLIAKPAKKDVVKLMVGSAFRAPSAYEFFYNDGGRSQISSFEGNGGAALKAERVWSVEAQWTRRFARDWTALGSMYATLANNIVETAPVSGSPDVIVYRNSSVQQRIVGLDTELNREIRAGVMISAHYGYSYARYASNPNQDPDLSDSLLLPNAPMHSLAAKVIFPIAGSINGALRAALEDRRRIDVAVDDKSNRAVIADAVLSGRANRYGVNYTFGLYNLFNWRYSLPGQPYASNLIPQNGRSVMLSIGMSR